MFYPDCCLLRAKKRQKVECQNYEAFLAELLGLLPLGDIVAGDINTGDGCVSDTGRRAHLPLLGSQPIS